MSALKVEQFNKRSVDSVFTTDMENSLVKASELQIRLNHNREFFKSGRIHPVNLNKSPLPRKVLGLNGVPIVKKFYQNYFVRKPENITVADANRLYAVGLPHKYLVNGYELYMEFNEGDLVDPVVLPQAPVSGYRKDLVFLEVWREEIKFTTNQANQLTDVVFPYGNVMYYDPKGALVDDCPLTTANQFGGNYPKYLVVTAGHGQYTRIDSQNLIHFISNPKHNVFLDRNMNVYQLRWRIAVFEDVDEACFGTPFVYDKSGRHYRPQGELASRPAPGDRDSQYGTFVRQDFNEPFNSLFDDNHLYIGSVYVDHLSPTVPIKTMSYDGIVMGIPLALVSRRNRSAWHPVSNPNGSTAISSGSTPRPDGLFYDQIAYDDVVDLRPVAPKDLRVFKERPAEALDGARRTFTFNYRIAENSSYLYHNGAVLDEGEGNDYVVSGNSVVFSPDYGPPAGKLFMDYVVD